MKPTLAVVIATLGRDTLLPTLRSLLSCRGGESLEIVVVGAIVDPAMASDLQQLAAAHANLLHLPLVFSSGDSSNKKNAGFRAATADIVAFIDDDVIVARDWSDRVLEAFADPAVGMVSGPSLVPDDVPLMARLAGGALSSAAAGYVASRYVNDGRGPRRIRWSGIIGCNMAFRRRVLEEAGGFDPRFWPGEEMVVSSAVEKGGHAIVFAPDAWLFHYPRSSLLGFVKQIYKYGATRIRLIRQGVGFEPTTLLPAIIVVVFVVLGAGACFSRGVAQVLAAGLVAYFAAALVATIALVARTRRGVDLLVFFMIPVMHVSYGVAQWVEILRPGRDLSESKRPTGAAEA
jgi:glycosyltransferase involved in cell wall biosynthesis